LNLIMAEAWVTLTTNDTYALGALVLAHSLKKVKTTRKIVVMITPGVSGRIREELTNVFDEVIEVNVHDSHDTENLALINRPDLGVTFTKLHCWRLTQYTKCVFLDADTLVIKNSDDLFRREELSAAPDIGWPDIFNSGVFVLRPNVNTYRDLVSLGVSQGSFDGGDQGLLNKYFSDWATKDISKHLPFIYNMSASAVYTYKPAYKQFGSNVHIVHFLGEKKPWSYHHPQIDTLPGSELLHEHLHMWWNIFLECVVEQLKAAEGKGAAAPEPSPVTAPQAVKRENSFEKIAEQLDRMLAIEVSTPKVTTKKYY